ncbi:alpha/beta hydrolase [Streptomonospora sp. PA3]|uniref:alpha/beta hydrolase n=1 Tax=Streptomonospora sp. PA3 TaxID=2607326 RepID=UPI0012DFC256|nr:alpha/beta hydrolase [Streptomonospora sp. PA3]MUL41724.1 alpha/beta hydrolase [Streptomonospora sp. PA3]
MPYGYLLTVAIAAVHTALALAPVRRPRWAAVVSFHLGLVVNETPVFVLCWLLAATLPAWAQEDLDTPASWAGLALAVLTAIGLAVIARRALDARPALERALRRDLGAGRPGAVDALLAAARRRAPSYLRTLLFPFRVRRADVERIADIAYGDAGVRNRLDVYRRRSGTSGGPILVYAHGGGYFSGRKNREARPLLYRLASRGWVCISANYRLRPRAGFDEHLADFKKAIAWAREHAPDYGGDPDALFAAGSSAGGHLAALAALTPNDPAFQPGFEDADTSLTAAVSLYGYYGRYYRRPGESERPTSPADHVRPDAPPFFAVHGDQDSLVPVEDARAFVAALRRASANPVVYAELPRAQHAFDLFRSPRFEAVIDAVEVFAARVLARERT